MAPADKSRATTPDLASSDIIHPPTTSIAAEGATSRLWKLKVLVFVAGGVLMGLEIVGSRVLAPHFGNSVFVWGSLISVFLTALSLGYYAGGWISDRNPAPKLLNIICAGVSLLIFLVAVLAQPVCEGLAAAGLGEQTGPLVAAIVLFLPASVGMGVVSPFAVKLATRSIESVGSASGTLYALSTLGSIVGTLVTTFVLIPWIGMTAIIQGLAATLLLISLITLPGGGRRATIQRLMLFLLLAGPCLLWPVPERVALDSGDRITLDIDTPYHHITVIDNTTIIDNTRYKTRQLRFDRFVESAIETVPPYRSLPQYTDYFHLAFLARSQIDRALFIGAGGGIGPRTFLAHNREMTVDLVDIDQKVLDVARDHFHLEPSPTLHLHAQDGRMFVRQSDATYDCVVLDAFTIGGGIPFHLATREFFTLCRAKMTPEGVFVMNINSAVEGPDGEIFQSLYRTLDSVFGDTSAFVVQRRRAGTKQSTNIILVATVAEAPLTPEDWIARGDAYTSASYIDTRRMRMLVDDRLPKLPDLSAAPLFTDDYAPLETMSF
jgi:spermidine synthase